jgi:hypothetical protein
MTELQKYIENNEITMEEVAKVLIAMFAESREDDFHQMMEVDGKSFAYTVRRAG